MKVKRAAMRYDQELGRWVVKGRDEWFSMRCGEGIQLHIGERTISGRVELGRTTWCIIAGGVPLGLLESQKYMVTIDV